jgi:hypothetical protein
MTIEENWRKIRRKPTISKNAENRRRHEAWRLKRHRRNVELSAESGLKMKKNLKSGVAAKKGEAKSKKKAKRNSGESRRRLAKMAISSSGENEKPGGMAWQ